MTNVTRRSEEPLIEPEPALSEAEGAPSDEELRLPDEQRMRGDGAENHTRVFDEVVRA